MHTMPQVLNSYAERSPHRYTDTPRVTHNQTTLYFKSIYLFDFE